MSTFSCQYQNYRGNLVVTEKEFYFTSSLFRIELQWSNVKRVRLETQQVKGVPTSVLVVVLQHNEVIRLQSANNASQLKRGSASKRFFFYGFQDLLGAEERVKHCLEQYRAAEKTTEKEGRGETDKDSSATTKRPEKAMEKDDVSSSETDPVKEDSLNLSRAVLLRRPDSEPSRAAVPLSFSGHRLTASSVSRPKIPAKLLTSSSSAAAVGRHNQVTAVLLKLYRHVALLTVLVMLFMLSRYLSRGLFLKDRYHATPSAEKLLRDIDALAGVMAELESYENQESLWRYNSGRKRLEELSHTYAQQLESTSVALVERYVAIQAKMATLRGQRAARVAHTLQSGVTAPLPPAATSCEFSAHKKNAAGVRVAATIKDTAAFTSSSSAAAADCSATFNDEVCAKGGLCKQTTSKTKMAATHQKKRKSPLSGLQADIEHWVHRGRAVWAFATRFFNAAHGDMPFLHPSSIPSVFNKGSSSGGRWVVYSEDLGESFHLTEWVATAEYEDRHKCLSLTKDLIDTVELTERVFATFTNVFLVNHYRRLVSGEERGSYWLQPPQALRSITIGKKCVKTKTFTGDALARMAMLRRFVASILHNEPLVSNQARRRATALHVAETLVRYRQEEIALLRARNRGHTDNTTVLWKILNDMIVTPTTKSLRGNPAIPASSTFLRNSVEELRFWHTHDSAWQEHVLTLFTPEQQADIRSTFSAHVTEEEERSLIGPSTQPAAMHWLGLPPFRGLLCFEGIPVLHEAVNATPTPQQKTGLEANDDIEEEGEAEGKEEGEEGVAGTADSAAVTGYNGSGIVVKASLLNITQAPPLPKLNSSESSAAFSSTAEETEEQETPTEPVKPLSASRPAPACDASTLLAGNTDLWKEVKLRWLADLDTFRLAFDPELKKRTSRAARSYRLDVEDRSVVADAAEVRRHLFALLAVVNENYVRYMARTVLQRFGAFLQGLLTPDFGYCSGKDVHVSTLQAWGMQDPAVQLATAQVTGLASGTSHEVSRSLLYLILQPPPLLQTSMLSTRKTMAAATVLILFAIVLAVLHFMQ